MRKVNTLSEKQLFFQRWLKTPLTLGAILPSSESLSRFMAHHVASETFSAIQEGGLVLEIGAGTGAFTHALLEASIPPKQLVSVELDPSLFLFLESRFPDVQTVCGDAQNLRELLPEKILSNISCVVSGIPMVTLPRDVQKNIIHEAFSILPQNGTFFQFTYSPFSSIPTHLYSLKKRRIGTVFTNFPPATVWAYSKAV